MIVEDGTGLPDADSYASEADFEAHAESHGLTYTGDVETALVRATAWIDGAFRSRFPGARTNGRSQGLEWPRRNATDASGEAIADDEIPAEIVRATAAAALRELTSVGSLSPDVTGGGAIRRERKRLGSMEKETEYAVSDGQRSPAPRFPEIDAILSGLIGSRGATIRLMRA